eukprot:CAMPEP_0118951494 /NCGR_PEP_ID=MMETSP1169-20130426/53237_1 /TAXON_ID=36882 /ORGANISM="Pyramimonas obovata, Strain CCMP722" /LENGTH=166 /DNA_ID=CAMNT_0006898563 /DNA_START=194 /DNA_END=691 /DNA_ORIENTATION=+
MAEATPTDSPQPDWVLAKLAGTPPSGRSGHTSTCIGRRVVIFGGGGESVYYNDLLALDTGEMRWSSIKSTGKGPEGRAYHSTVRIGSQLFIFGGWKGDKFLNDLYVLSGFTAECKGEFRWSTPTTHGHVTARAYHTSTAVGSSMLVFGGWFTDFCNDLMVLNTLTM